MAARRGMRELVGAWAGRAGARVFGSAQTQSTGKNQQGPQHPRWAQTERQRDSATETCKQA
eukprot:13257763-Alexandrium_andersonii.AAC.1